MLVQHLAVFIGPDFSSVALVCTTSLAFPLCVFFFRGGGRKDGSFTAEVFDGIGGAGVWYTTKTILCQILFSFSTAANNLVLAFFHFWVGEHVQMED